MRVFLIACYSPFKNTQVGPPLGLLYLSSSLRRLGFETGVLDMRVLRLSVDGALAAVREFRPDVVGLSAMTRETRIVGKLAQGIKDAGPQVPVIVGGPCCSSPPEALLADPNIDYLVSGEGEESFGALLQALEAGSDPEQIPGVTELRRGKPGPPTRPVANLSSLPFPDWEAVDFRHYHDAPRLGLIGAHREYFTMVSSRGCPFRCSFCQNFFGRQVRFRDASNVVDEMETLHREYGIKDIHFLDDIFNLDRGRVLDICARIESRDLRLAIAFPVGLRAELVDEEVLRALKRVGVYRIPYGIESASPRIQKLMHKELDLDKVLDVIRMTERMGIIAHGFFMLGFPGETREEMTATINYARKSRLHLATFNFVNAFPGTELYEMARRMGLIDNILPEEYDFDAPPVSLSRLSQVEMNRMTRQAHFQFYFNPLRLARFLKVLPRKRQILELLRLFLGKIHFFHRRNAPAKVC